MHLLQDERPYLKNLTIDASLADELRHYLQDGTTTVGAARDATLSVHGFNVTPHHAEIEVTTAPADGTGSTAVTAVIRPLEAEAVGRSEASPAPSSRRPPLDTDGRGLAKTYVNGRRLSSADDTVTLAHGDRIIFGHAAVFVYLEPNNPEAVDEDEARERAIRELHDVWSDRWAPTPRGVGSMLLGRCCMLGVLFFFFL